MTLAEKCEALWPLGWSVVDENANEVIALCLRHQVSVMRHKGSFHAYYLQAATAPLPSLPQLFEKVRQGFQDILEAGIPALVEVPVNQQAAEILQVQGWERGGSETWYMQPPFQVALCPARVDLWYNGYCVKTIVLEQGKVREQLKALLTFPQWKEP